MTPALLQQAACCSMGLGRCLICRDLGHEGVSLPSCSLHDRADVYRMTQSAGHAHSSTSEVTQLMPAAAPPAILRL